MKILQRYTNACLWEGDAVNMREAVEKVVASYAVLTGAVLTGAVLTGAVLTGADKLKYAGETASRSDGYEFRAFVLADGTLKIKAGCRWFTLAEARAHWITTRGGTRLGEESLAIVENLERMHAIAERYAAVTA